MSKRNISRGIRDIFVTEKMTENFIILTISTIFGIFAKIIDILYADGKFPDAISGITKFVQFALRHYQANEASYMIREDSTVHVLCFVF